MQASLWETLNNVLYGVLIRCIVQVNTLQGTGTIQAFTSLDNVDLIVMRMIESTCCKTSLGRHGI